MTEDLCHKNKTVWNQWCENAAAHPDRDAVIHWIAGEEPFRWTFSSLLSAAKDTAASLIERGIGKGEVHAVGDVESLDSELERQISSDAESLGEIEVYDPSHGLIGKWPGSRLLTSPLFGPNGETFALGADHSILRLKIELPQQ